jgi:molybdate transport system regulatory protein
MEEQVEIRLRLLLGSSIAIGPGKAELLRGIRDTGSIAAAGRRMNMSYRRSWLLVRTRVREPLVDATKGGSGGGGARLTDAGLRVLALYEEMERKALQSIAEEAAGLRAMMRDAPQE